MSETLRDLVASLSLNSDNFTRNITFIVGMSIVELSEELPRLLPEQNAISWTDNLTSLEVVTNWSSL